MKRIRNQLMARETLQAQVELWEIGNGPERERK
jgi:hypothetical protein